MDAKKLLEQFLNASKDMGQQGANLAENKLGVPKQGPERDAMLSGAGKGAMAAGALALLLGTNTGRRVGVNAAKVGGLAAVAGLAYSAWQTWQQQQGQTNANPQAPASGHNTAQPLAGQRTDTEHTAGHDTAHHTTRGFVPLPLGSKPAEQSPAADERSLALLKAMIAAAKADGHIDDQERTRINEQFEQLQLDPAAAKFIQQEIEKPLNPEEIGALAASTEQAAEIYLVSRLVIDADNFMEKAYLQALAESLGLPETLVGELESQVSSYNQ